MTISEADKLLIEPPIVLCEDCGNLTIKFDHIPNPQPCVWCEEKKRLESVDEG